MPEITEWEMVIRVLVAVALGGAIGVERELDAQPAGFRTHVLIALGAALFGLVSIQGFTMFADPRADTNVNIDVTRVASQVVVGVGFLGGGAILKWGASVRGLTTAASIWVVAAIGLAVGLGYFSAGVTVTVAVLVSLVALRQLRRRLRRWAKRSETVVVRLRAGNDAAEVIGALEDHPDIAVRSLRIEGSGDDDHGTEVEAQIKTERGVALGEMLSQLARRPDVAAIEIEDR